MGKLKSGLVSLVLTAASTFAGCNGFSFGGISATDLTKTEYVPAIQKKAEELSKSSDIKDIANSIQAYGSIGQLDKMDEQINKIINADINKGITYSQVGQEYHELFKK